MYGCPMYGDGDLRGWRVQEFGSKSANKIGCGGGALLSRDATLCNLYGNREKYQRVGRIGLYRAVEKWQAGISFGGYWQRRGACREIRSQLVITYPSGLRQRGKGMFDEPDGVRFWQCPHRSQQIQGRFIKTNFRNAKQLMLWSGFNHCWIVPQRLQ